MIGPNFVCNALNYTIENPSDWTVTPIVGKLEDLTLDGSTVQDISFRKYSYQLKWSAMSKADYDKIEEIFNYHIDNARDVVFTYGKWSQASSGVDCKMSVSARDFVAGSGNTFYYSGVTITLMEVVKR